MNTYRVYKGTELMLDNATKSDIQCNIKICEETIEKYARTGKYYKKIYRIQKIDKATDICDRMADILQFKKEWDETCKMVKENARKLELWQQKHKKRGKHEN